MANKEEVIEVLDMVRPSLMADGGDVKFVDLKDDGTVVVELIGACKGCPMSALTLANGIERILKERVEGITAVVQATEEDLD